MSQQPQRDWATVCSDSNAREAADGLHEATQRMSILRLLLKDLEDAIAENTPGVAEGAALKACAEANTILTAIRGSARAEAMEKGARIALSGASGKWDMTDWYERVERHTRFLASLPGTSPSAT